MIIEKNTRHHSLSEVHGSVDTNTSFGWKKIFSFLGPAYLISVGYMDPGNWATDLQGGSNFGYSLIWVLLMSNLMALLLQGLSARLGIVQGRDLAQANREAYPKIVNFILYILAEIAIAACDLAEVLGMAIGIQLLTGLSLIWGVSLTVLDTFLLLYLQRLGMRKMEAFIITLVGIIAGAFLIEMIMAKPALTEIASGFVPNIRNDEALYIAIGIIGATVMPHNLYLHSALVQTRKIERSEKGIQQAIKFNRIDSVVALNLAFFVNASILIVAATVFFKTGHPVDQIHDAYHLLPNFLGKVAPLLFAIALIAAGQSSTITGTLAGQIVMEGYLHLRINPWLRRLITRLLAVIPAVVVIMIAGEKQVTNLLVFSQVLLSLQLGFAIIPLILFVSDKKKMGEFVIKTPMKILAWFVTLILVYLNLRMVYGGIAEYFSSPDHIFTKGLILLSAAGFIGLLLITFIYPLTGRYQAVTPRIHRAPFTLKDMVVPAYNKIAIALDFSGDDSRIIANALSQGNSHTEYVLIHIVESVPAKLLGFESDDHESRTDKEQLETYISLLEEKNIRASSILGYRNRPKEIVRIVKEQQADLLVLGGHGHTGIKDWIYGETVNYVRHYVNIPVLIVK